MDYRNDPNFQYFSHVADMAKSASIQLGGTGVTPTGFGNQGGGMSDPDEAMAFHAQNAAMRAEANAMNYLGDAPVTGTGLRPYADLLNLNDQSIAYSVNNPGYMAPQKTANNIDWDYEPTIEEHEELMKTASVNGEALFYNYIPTQQDWFAIQAAVNEKTASDVQNFFVDAYNNGYFEANGLEDTIPFIFGE
jgi:hypothetical protein